MNLRLCKGCGVLRLGMEGMEKSAGRKPYTVYIYIYIYIKRRKKFKVKTYIIYIYVYIYIKGMR
jgi:hypothetical protein